MAEVVYEFIACLVDDREFATTNALYFFPIMRRVLIASHNTRFSHPAFYAYNLCGRRPVLLVTAERYCTSVALLPNAISARGATVMDYACPLPLKDHLGVGQNKLNKPEERFRATVYYSAST